MAVGNQERAFTPGSQTEALEIYRTLSLIRQCQEAIIREYPSDEIKTPVHLGIGLEAISAGVAHCLPPNTKSFGQLRNHGQYLAITGDTDRFFGELYGKVTGAASGKGGSMHLSSQEHNLISTSGIVASTISLAVGAAFAAKYRGTDEFSVAMFGDAAVEEGEFWESLNFACLHRLRVLFVCEDNDLSIHTSGSDRRGFKGKSISEAVQGFDCYSVEGDGTDVLEVAGTVRHALDLVRNDPKPAFLCFNWFRALEHVGPNADFHVGYRPLPSSEDLQNADPCFKYQQHLLSSGIDSSCLESIRQELNSQIEKSLKEAKDALYPTEEDLYRGVFT